MTGCPVILGLMETPVTNTTVMILSAPSGRYGVAAINSTSERPLIRVYDSEASDWMTPPAKWYVTPATWSAKDIADGEGVLCIDHGVNWFLDEEDSKFIRGLAKAEVAVIGMESAPYEVRLAARLQALIG